VGTAVRRPPAGGGPVDPGVVDAAVVVPVGGAAGLVLVVVLGALPDPVVDAEPELEAEAEAEALDELVWRELEPQPPVNSASPAAAARIGPARARRLIAVRVYARPGVATHGPGSGAGRP
jgi:hypothetical protein